VTARVIVVLVFAVGALLRADAAAIVGSAQDPQRPPIFRTAVDLVQFDVSVLDKQRRPIRGLTAADFTVLEDGKAQPIAAFAAVDVPSAPPPGATWMRKVTPDVQTNDLAQHPEGRLFLILIDDAMLPFDDLRSARSAKDIARSVVDRLGPSDQAAVVFSVASANVQNFTADRSKLLRAIDTLHLGSASHMLGWDSARGGARGLDGDILYRQGSLETLRNAADVLIAAPQRRKALILISPGIAVDFASEGQPVLARGAREGGVSLLRETNSDLVRQTPEMFRAMRAANVTVYSVDPCGFSGLFDYVVARGMGTGNFSTLASRAPPAGYRWLDANSPPGLHQLARHMANVNMDFLMTTASNTGGRAIVNTSEFEPGLDGIFEENSSYYVLGYAQPPKNKPGSLHRVTVRVNRPDVTVRTRDVYETTAPSTELRADAKKAMGRAAAGPVADGELPLEVVVAPVMMPGQKEAAVTIVLGFRQPAVTTRTSQTLELETSLFTPDGRRRGVPRRQSASVTLVPGGGERGLTRYELLTQIAAEPGRYELRLAAHRASDGLSGSVYADVEVPDFAGAPLSLSGVWLEALPGHAAIPKDAFAGLLPIVPTASRDFARTDAATAYYRIYQGGDSPLEPVTLTVRIVDEKDAQVAEATGTIGVERFGPQTRMAEQRFALPLRELASSRYWLSFDVRAGKASARRDVVFRVR
jgi:VWFA-related protein